MCVEYEYGNEPGILLLEGAKKLHRRSEKGLKRFIEEGRDVIHSSGKNK